MAELATPGETVARTEGQKEAENARAREVGKNLQDKKAAQVINKADAPNAPSIKNFPAGERVLYFRALLIEGDGDGLSAQDINASDTEDTILVDRAKGSDVRISEITASTTIDGEPGYICKTPDGRDVPILADELIAAHAKKNADAIAETYDDLSEAALVKWVAQGAEGDCPVPSAQVETMDVVEDVDVLDTETLMQVNELINQQIDALQVEITQLEATNEGNRNADRINDLRALLRDSQVSTFMNGPRGILYKAGVLKNIQIYRTPQGVEGNTLAVRIDGLLEEMQQDGILKKAEDELIDTLKNSDDISNERYEELGLQVLAGDSLSVLREEDVSALPGMNEALFGNPDMTNAVIDRLIDNPQVDQETRDQLREARESGNMNKLNFLLLLLLLPAGVLAGTVEAVSFFTKNQR